jgi:choloylglycine hydrolase
MGGNPGCVGSLKWTNSYSHVSIDIHSDIGGVGVDVASDGMNEAGLTVSAQTHREAVYQDPLENGRPASGGNVCWADAVPWILGSFSTVEDLSAALKTVSVVGPRAAFPISKGEYLHWSVDDAHGGHIVVEYVDGQLQLHNNTVGTFTNDPEYGWHLRNLNNYANLNPQWPTGDEQIGVVTEIGVVPKIVGHGLNLLGVPGDYSPPSRFVKLFYLRQFAMLNNQVTDVNQSIALVTGILNTVFIPKGVVADDPAGGDRSLEFTQYSIIKIPQQRKLLFKTYDNQQWRLLNLDHMNLNESAYMPLSDGTMGIQDVSANFP